MMYNNFPQTPPYYYGYGYQQFARPMATQENAAGATPSQPQTPIYAPQPGPAQNFIKGRPVVSIDEARASQIDLDGSLYVFPDLGNKRIYTKQINLDGTAAFNVFTLEKEAETQPEQPKVDYVTKDELAVILDQFKQSLAAPKATSSKSSAPINF